MHLGIQVGISDSYYYNFIAPSFIATTFDTTNKINRRTVPITKINRDE